MDSNKEHKEILNWLDGDNLSQNVDDAVLAKEIEAIQPIIAAADQFTVPPIDTDRLFEKIENKISNNDEKRKVISFRTWFSIAAAIFAFATICLVVINQDTQIKAESSIVAHTLPDNSSVTINRNSQITYESDFKDHRVLNLTGEAFFEVQKGESFVVNTSEGKVEVLGTSFNVKVSENHFNVRCKTGKVRVSAKGNEYLLTPGKSIMLGDGHQGIIEEIDNDNIDDWVRGKSNFTSKPLIDVVNELVTIYQVKIELPAKYQDQLYSGFFIHNDLDQALKMIFLPMNINYKVEETNKVVILD